MSLDLEAIRESYAPLEDGQERWNDYDDLIRFGERALIDIQLLIAEVDRLKALTVAD